MSNEKKGHDKNLDKDEKVDIKMHKGVSTRGQMTRQSTTKSQIWRGKQI